jgi:hypothetical protein
MSSQTDVLRDLIMTIRTHPEADFYCLKWGSAERFETLPTIGRSDLVEIPLSRRRYKREKEFVKLVHVPEGTFALESPHESLEKSVWCYEQGRVPLIGEQNEAVAAYGAEAYRVDSLIADVPSLKKLQSYLEKRPKPLGALSIHLSAFSKEEIEPFARFAEAVRLVLILPETGAIAEAEFSEEPIFIPHEGTILEHGEELLLTKLAYLTTPIIRYRTDIRTRPFMERKDGAFVLI